MMIWRSRRRQHGRTRPYDVVGLRHTLALEPETWTAVADGRRTFDVRLVRPDDLGYFEGDLVALWEVADGRGVTGRCVARRVGDVVPIYRHATGLVVGVSLLEPQPGDAADAKAAGPPRLEE